MLVAHSASSRLFLLILTARLGKDCKLNGNGREDQVCLVAM